MLRSRINFAASDAVAVAGQIVGLGVITSRIVFSMRRLLSSRLPMLDTFRAVGPERARVE